MLPVSGFADPGCYKHWMLRTSEPSSVVITITSPKFVCFRPVSGLPSMSLHILTVSGVMVVTCSTAVLLVCSCVLQLWLTDSLDAGLPTVPEGFLDPSNSRDARFLFSQQSLQFLDARMPLSPEPQVSQPQNGPGGIPPLHNYLNDRSACCIAPRLPSLCTTTAWHIYISRNDPMNQSSMTVSSEDQVMTRAIQMQ